MTQGVHLSIHVRGEDKTRQISDWEIRWDGRRKALMLVCHFPSGKSYPSLLSDCLVTPTRELGKTLLVEKGSAVFHELDEAAIYGENDLPSSITGRNHCRWLPEARSQARSKAARRSIRQSNGSFNVSGLAKYS